MFLKKMLILRPENSSDSSKNDEMESRSYQIEIEEHAVKHNTIIYLPTGAGKTFIAIQIMKRMQRDLQLPFSMGGMKTMFMVNTIPLVYQHAKVVKELTALTVATFTSQDKVDLWNHDQWLSQLESAQVIIMTAQILLDMLLHGYITLDRINLIIFDECHRAVDNHPMRLIMARFADIPPEKAPKVIGLTATLINKNVKHTGVEAAIRSLEATFNAKICTSGLTDEIKSHSANPYELITAYPKGDLPNVVFDVLNTKLTELDTILSTVNDVLLCEQPATKKVPGLKDINQKESYIKKLKRLLLTIHTLMDESGPYGLSLVFLYSTVKLERIKLKCAVQITHLIQKLIITFTTCRAFLERYMSDCDGYKKITKYSSPKLLLLLKMLKEYDNNATQDKKINKQSEPLCGIIFVQERTKSLLLNMFLKKVVKENPEEFSFLKHNYITGFNSNPFNDTREALYDVKKNKLVVLEFRKGLTNCLISTDILEEGFDLPRCNLVIRYDEIKTFRSYIQSKGRGRFSDASYVIMVPADNSSKFHDQYSSYQLIYETLNKALIGKTNNRELPHESELAKLYDCNQDNYKFKSANITLNSALTLINRYCMSLTSDLFTEATPTWYQRELNHGKSIIYIKLPADCPLKTMIMSPPVIEIKLGKQKAALEALKQLHLMGELNDNLLPKDRNEIVMSEENISDFFSHWENTDGAAKSTAKSTIYNKKFPSCLDGVASKRTKDNHFYLQYISYQPIDNSVYKGDTELFRMLQSKSTYGFLTYNKIDRLCPFTLYASYSEVSVRIEVSNIPINLNETQLDLVKRFHLLVFVDVLEINQRFVAFDQTLGKNSYLITPVFECSPGTVVIDWSTLHAHKSVEKISEPSIDERRHLNVKKEEYSQSIVSPWYRHDNSRYAITEVSDTKTPLSPFPNNQFVSFAQYFKERYGLTVHGNMKQPLLSVKSIGGKMNCLLPRSITLKSEENLSKKKMRDLLDLSAEDVSKNDEIILIPEFCTRFSFPGVLWLKGIFLPSIIHRFTMLLQAEDLRQIIVKNTGIGNCVESADFEWPQMKVDIYSLKFYQKLLETSKQQMESTTEIKDYLSTLSTNEFTYLPTKSANNALMDFEISKNNIENGYPWKAEMEPVDINRNVTEINLIDIECYEKFVNEKISTTSDILKKKLIMHRPLDNAICAPSHVYNEKINILDLKISSKGPSPGTILEALTIARSNDVFNLERYESLGDSYLKYACSLYIFEKFPKYNEGSLTTLKSKIISNENLQKAAKLIDLAGRMKVKTFNGKMDWMLPSFRVPAFIEKMVHDNKISTAFQTIEIPRDEMVTGNISTENVNSITSLLSDKSRGDCDIRDCEAYFGKISVRNKEIADCVEALLGIYLLDSGIEGANKIIKWLQILPRKENPRLDILNQTCDPRTRARIDRQLDFNLNKIEDILGYKFKNPLLLLEALTHSSNIKNNITGCYQRLEFIGDAVLDFLITCYIYERNTSMDPGEITDLRSALVNNVTFACLCVRLGLHKFMLSTNIPLENAIYKFALFQTERNHIIDEAVLILLVESDCTMATSVDIPKALGDVFESIAGAIYIDSNKCLKTVWKHFYKFMQREIAEFSINTPKQPVRQLYERVHAAPQFFPAKVLKDGNVMVPLKIDLKGKITICYGIGGNKEHAKRSAAKVALKFLN